MKRKYRFIDVAIAVLAVLFFIYIVLLFQVRPACSVDYGGATTYNVIADPDSAALEQLPDTLPHARYVHLADSIRAALRGLDWQNEGAQNGMSIGGILGFMKIRGCDTCTKYTFGFDSQYPVHHYITLGDYILKPDTAYYDNKYPVYYRRMGKDSLKYIDLGAPVIGKRGGLAYSHVTLKRKALPFRYDKRSKLVMLPVSETVYSVGFVLHFVISFALLIGCLYMVRCFIVLCIDIARGNFFISENKHRLNVIAYGLIALQLLTLLAPYLLRLIFSSYFTGDLMMVDRSLSDMGLWGLLIGGFFWLIARAFDKGMKLQEEQELTV